MKPVYILIISLIIIIANCNAQQPKTISDCTLVYDVMVEDANADAEVVKSMSNATQTLFIKGSKSRLDLVTPSFVQTSIYNTKSDTIVVLRELGNSKYISYLTTDQLSDKNKKYQGIQFKPTTEKKVILGYDCQKVEATLADGSIYNVYYTRSVVPSNKLANIQFSSLPGLVLEYEAETEDGKTKIKYTASKISLLPVPNAKFDTPTSGYRVL